METRRFFAVTVSLTLTGTAGCQLLHPPPSDQEVTAAVKESSPAPSTAGPTYLADLTSVQVEDRGLSNSDGKYWPIHVRLKGGVKINATPSSWGFSMVTQTRRRSPWSSWRRPLRQENFGKWRVSYAYDPHAAKWRRDDRDGSCRDR